MRRAPGGGNRRKAAPSRAVHASPVDPRRLKRARPLQSPCRCPRQAGGGCGGTHMYVNHVGPLSLAKVAGSLYVLVGLIVGFVVAILSLLVAGVPGTEAPFARMAGVGAVVVLPILYGAFGFLGGLILASLFNVAARFAGGVQVQLDEHPASGHLRADRLSPLPM